MSIDPKLQSELIAIGLNVVFLLILFKIINVVDRKIIEKIRSQESNSPLLRFMPIIIKIIKVVLICIAATGLLQTHGYSMSSIIAGFGIGGLAVGMAAKDTLADIFGSISLLSDKVYKIGDYVKVNGIEGYVEDISIRSTKIRDLDNFLNTIPNNMAANAIVTNVSQAYKRLLKITFGVTYSTSNESIEKAKQLLEQIGKNHKDINKDFTIAIHDLGESSINIRFMGYVKTGSYYKFLKVRGEFIAEVIKAFRENNIDFAFPSRSIYIEKTNNTIEK